MRFLKKFFPLCTSLLFLNCAWAHSLLVFDGNPSSPLPPQFRSTQQLSALSDLHAMGSAQFTAKQLKTIAKNAKAPLIIVDLRQESHGFVNGLPISWYGYRNWTNLGKTPYQIAKEEKQQLAALKPGSEIIINRILEHNAQGTITKVKPKKVFIKTVASEQTLAKHLGLGYQRIYVSDHKAPDPQQVDQFIQLVKDLPHNSWLYFHCRGGKGRTTTFMVMYDIMRNAPTTSLKSIVQRQQELGGINLFSLPKNNNFKYIYARQRAEFIKAFYRYVRREQTNFKETWSQWIKHSSPKKSSQ